GGCRRFFIARRSRQGEQAPLVFHEGVRAEKNAFDPTEYGGIGADPHREAENGQRGEPRTATKLSKPVPQITENGFQAVHRACLPALFFDLRYPSQRLQRREASLRGGHALGKVIPDLQLKVVSQLLP